jgi:hypothetical protein
VRGLKSAEHVHKPVDVSLLLLAKTSLSALSKTWLDPADTVMTQGSAMCRDCWVRN